MRRLLIILAIVTLPKIAAADAKLYGTWTLTRAWAGQNVAAFPPGLVVKVSLDAKKYVFTVLFDGEKMQQHKGTWAVTGKKVTFWQTGTDHTVWFTYKLRGDQVTVSRTAGNMLFTRRARQR